MLEWALIIVILCLTYVCFKWDREQTMRHDAEDINLVLQKKLAQYESDRPDSDE